MKIFISEMINYASTLMRADLLCEWETEALRSRFRDPSNKAQVLGAQVSPQFTDHVLRIFDVGRCDLQLRVNARQDKRNLSFSLGPIEAWLAQFYSDQLSFIVVKEEIRIFHSLRNCTLNTQHKFNRYGLILFGIANRVYFDGIFWFSSVLNEII